MLEPAWIAAHADRFDVMHLHFGGEAVGVKRLEAVLMALRAAGTPLVHTVHDLSHPQLVDQSAHRAQLDVLIPAANGLITLTPGAADEIEARWGRRPLVLAHPRMLPSGVAPAAVPAAGSATGTLLGLHLRDLRPSIDGPGATATLLAAAARLREDGTPVKVQVAMHDRVRDTAARDRVRWLCAEAPHAQLQEGPRPVDRRLEAELAQLAVSVLPYRHGTHSGWLELCWDLGVPVAGPRLGHLADQHSDPGFYRSFAPGDERELRAALEGLLATPEAVAGSPERSHAQVARRAGRDRDDPLVATAHIGLYRAMITRVRRESGR